MLSLLSRWLARHHDTSVAVSAPPPPSGTFIAGQGARIYSLAAFRQRDPGTPCFTPHAKRVRLRQSWQGQVRIVSPKLEGAADGVEG